MSITYEPMTSIVPNTTMRKRLTNGVLGQYLVKPSPEYVMHDAGYDWLDSVPRVDEYGNIICDEFGIPQYLEIPKLGYRPTEAAVGYNYDWTPVQMLDEADNTIIAYGERQFFCKLATDVPADQIFGVTNPPEIM